MEWTKHKTRALISALTLWSHSALAQPLGGCFLNTQKVMGVSVLGFSVAQYLSANACDQRYQQWRPSLTTLHEQVMSAAARNQYVNEFITNAERYAGRRSLDFNGLMTEISAAMLPLLSHQPLSLEICAEFERTLHRRIASQDEMIGAAIVDLGAARASGRMCNN